jgi:DNA polymerase
MMRKGFFAGSTVKAQAPPGLIPECGACGLYRSCNSPKMPVSGKGKRGILIVAEAPGQEEDEKGEQLIGRSGKYLEKVLAACGVSLHDDCWKTNAIICHPGDKKPTSTEVDYCLPNITKAIKTLKPQTIIVLGGLAVRAVLRGAWGKSDVGSIAQWQGVQSPSQAYNAWVCPTFHPAYVLRRDDKVINRLFREDIEAALEHDTRPWERVPDWKSDVRLILDDDEAARAIERVAEPDRGGMLAFDYETNMLKPDAPQERIVSASIAWGHTVPKKVFAFLWRGKAVKAFRKMLRSPIPKIAANMKFEDRWTRRQYKHRVRNWYWDTMLAAHVIDGRLGITGLKFQSLALLGMPSFNEHIEPFLKSKGDKKVNQILQEIDTKDLLTYNGLDSLLEFRVAVAQMQKLNYPLPWEQK